MFKSLGKLTFLGLMASMAFASKMAWDSREEVQRYFRMREM